VFLRREEKERERERELVRIIDSAQIIFVPPFYIPACHMPILALSSTRPNGDV
jgi:hypothetical protein